MDHQLNRCGVARGGLRRNLGVDLIHSDIAWSQTGELHIGCDAVYQHIHFELRGYQGGEWRGLAARYGLRDRTKSGGIDGDEVPRVGRLAEKAIHMWHGQYAGVREHDRTLAFTGSIDGENAGRGVLRGG